MMVDTLPLLRTDILNHNRPIIKKLQDFLLTSTEHIELKDILVRIHTNPVHHLTICLDLSYLQHEYLGYKSLQP
jgi:hypothetical protein